MSSEVPTGRRADPPAQVAYAWQVWQADLLREQIDGVVGE